MKRPSPNLLIAVTFVLACGVAVVARADMGPNFRRPTQLNIQYSGESSGDEKVVIAILQCGPEAKGLSVEQLPGFEGLELPPLVDCRWSTTIEAPLQPLILRPESWSQSSSIKLVLLLKDRRQVFVTNAVETHPFHPYYIVQLESDGAAKLTVGRGGQPSIAWLWAVWQRGFLFALLVTCLLETIVLVVWACWRRSTAVGRVAIRCLLVNVLTLTFVWGATLIGFGISGNAWFGFVILGWTELLAVLVEGAAYALGKPLTLADAFAGSLLANLASFGAGVALAGV